MTEEPKKKHLPSSTRKQCLLVLLFLLLLWPATSRGSDHLEAAWQEVVQAPKTSVQFLAPAINHLIQRQQQNQTTNATLHSLALLEMASQPDLKENVKTLLTTAAVTLSPDYSFPETSRSNLLFQQQHYLKSLFSLARAYKKFRTNPQESLYTSTFFWFAVAFVPLALFFFVSLLMAVKYYRAFCDMGRLKLNRQGSLILLAVTAASAIIIILVPAPLPGLLLLAGGLLLLATKRDAITLTLLLSTLVVVPFAYEKGMTSLLALDSSLFKAARQTASGLYNEAGEALLRQPATNQSQLALQLFSQAESARLRKEYAKAGIFLNKIITEKIELGAVYNNLANLYLLQGKPGKTETLYRQAIKLEKASGAPYYNLSQAYIRQSFDLEKSSQALEQAFKLNPALNQSLADNKELQGSIKLIFMALPDNFYRRYADSQPGKNTFLPEFLSHILFPGATNGLYFTLVLLSLGGFIYLSKRTPANRKICTLCGRLFYPAQKQKEKNCHSCRLINQLAIAASFVNAKAKPGEPGNRLFTLAITVGGALLPGFYPFITGNILIAISLLLPTLLWFYNILICQTGIMDPLPPSTLWLTLILPILIWTINLVVLALMRFRQQRRSFLRSNP